MKTAIITGITGQDGAYLSRFLLGKNYRIIGLSRCCDEKILDRLNYLGIADNITLEECDLLDFSSIMRLLSLYQPDEVYNFAAQSSVGLSFSQPIETISFNTISVLNLLEAVRTVKPDTRLYQASSSEMFGKVSSLPIVENSILHPVSPYAISKASAHWTVVNYRESYKLFACCGICFNHESFLRNRDFFIKKVITATINISRGKQDSLRVGNIDIKRDFGYSPKYVEAMYLMMQQDTPDDYVICSGRSISLRDIIYHVFDRVGVDRNRLVVDQTYFRPNEITDIYGDNRKARTVLNWSYDINFMDILDLLIEEENKNTL